MIRHLVLALAVSVQSLPGVACGPDYYYQIYEETGFPTATAFEFNLMVRAEMTMTKAKGVEPAQISEVGKKRDATVACDVADYEESLGKLPAEKAKPLVEAYTTLRNLVFVGPTAFEEAATAMSKDLPPEFLLYLRGATNSRAGKDEDATDAWRELLALPEKERRYRTIWAAYMLAASSGGDGDFRDLERLRAEGFKDRCDLTQRGQWHAYLRLRNGSGVDAVVAASHAMSSGFQIHADELRKVVSKALRSSEEEVRKLARDPLALGLASAALASDFSATTNRFVGGYFKERFGGYGDFDKKTVLALLDEVQKTKGLVLPKASNLAWLAYQAGNDELARRFLGVGDKKDPFHAWVSARLALKAGRGKQAYDILVKQSYALENQFFNRPTAQIPTPTTSEGNSLDIYGILATIRATITRDAANVALANGMYRDAAIQYLRAAEYDSALYLVERVLTLEEAKFVVEKALPGVMKPVKIKGWRADKMPAEVSACGMALDSWWMNCDEFNLQVRSAYGRRLFRNGKYEQAKKYLGVKPEVVDRYLQLAKETKGSLKAGLTPERLAKIDELVELLKTGDLSGMATDPDYYRSPERLVRQNDGNLFLNQRVKAGWTTPGELVRHKQSRPTPDKARSYLYNAADLRWDAAKAMPDNSDDTAAFLYHTGLWFKYLNPKEAEKYYHAILNRCGDTQTGKELKAKKWL